MRHVWQYWRRKIPAQILHYIVLVLFLSLVLIPQQAAALSAAQKKALQSGIYYFNTEIAAVASTCPGNNAAGAGEPGLVYLVGDSIGTQIRTTLASGLSGQGWSLTANVLSSRNLSGTPPTPDGLGAVEQDKNSLQAARAVIVELGTNSGGFSAATVGQMVDKVRSYAPEATIYWVDTAVVQRQDYAQTLSNVNSIIHTQASQSNFQVISWNKAVFGDGADPKNIDANAPDNGYIRRDDQYVHLTDEGITAMTDLIVSSLTGTRSSANGCSCSANLVGADNAEKIYNFLISKGLTPIQAVGIMGNLQAESGFDPGITERGNGIGFGIAQWSFGRRTALEEAARTQGVDVADLGFQLEYLYNESNARQSLDYPGTSEWEGLKRQTTVTGAVFYWERNFERPKFPGQVVRVQFANALLLRFGSNTPVVGGSPCG